MTNPARTLWTTLETVHDVVYFAPEVREAGKGLGLRGFWMTYFAFRAAPLGPVGPSVVGATFAGFAPEMIAKAIPAAWAIAEPALCLSARADVSARVLRQHGLEAEAAAEAAALLIPIVEAADGTGRALFAGNQALPVDADPIKALWQAAGTIREHRGDGHIAALVAQGITGLQSHLLQVAGGRSTADAVWASRGWTEPDWDGAAAELHDRGLLSGEHRPTLTEQGRSLLAAVETATDELSWRHCLAPLGADAVERLVALLRPAVSGVRASGMVPAANPMGLPSSD